MDIRVEKVLNIWHKHFEDESKQYSEFESSDVEYFVGCLLYNHFAFEKALDTMKTIDLSYDFLESCDEEYDEIMQIIKTIEIDDELEKIKFLQNYLFEVMQKYTQDELYLLNRLNYHTNGLSQRYNEDVELQKVEFQSPVTRSANPLLR